MFAEFIKMPRISGPYPVWINRQSIRAVYYIPIGSSDRFKLTILYSGLSPDFKFEAPNLTQEQIDEILAFLGLS